MEKRTPKHRPVPNPNPNPVCFLHLRWDYDGTVSNYGGATIAYRTSVDALATEAAWARCNPHDNFNRKIGRAIAVGNLDFNRLYRLPPGANRDETRETILAFFKQKLQDAAYKEAMQE